MKRSGFTPLARFAVAAALLVSSCGGGSNTNSSTGGGALSCNGLKVGAVVHFRGPYTEEILAGTKAAADECKASYQDAGPSAIDPPTEIKEFQDLMQTGVKAITTVAYPSDIWVRPIDNATNAGVPVATYDVASPASLETVHVGPRNLDIGKAMADAYTNTLGSNASTATGSVVLGICFPGLDVLEARVTGFKNEMQKVAPKMTVLGAFDTTFDPAKNYAAWQQLVSAHPDAKAFAGVCENDLNALEKIKAKDPNAKYFIESVGINAEALQGIKSGVGGAAIGQQPFIQGYVAMKMLLLKVEGKANVKRGWVNTGVEIVTTANVDQVLARENSLSSGPSQSLAFYKTTLDKIFADPAAAVTSLGDYVATS